MFLYHILLIALIEIIKTNEAASSSKNSKLIPCPNSYFSEKIYSYDKEKEILFKETCEVKCAQNQNYFGIWYINEEGKPEAACWNSHKKGEMLGYNPERQKCECGIHLKRRLPSDRQCKPKMEIIGISSSELCANECDKKMIHTHYSESNHRYIGFCYVKDGYKYPTLFGIHSSRNFSTYHKFICRCAVRDVPEDELSAIEQRRVSNFKPSYQYYVPQELHAIVDALKSGESVDLSRIFPEISASLRKSSDQTLIPCPNAYYSDDLYDNDEEKQIIFQKNCEFSCAEDKNYFGIWFLNERGKPEAACWNTYKKALRLGYNAEEQKCECGIHFRPRQRPDRNCKPKMEFSGISSSELCDKKCNEKTIHIYKSNSNKNYLGFCYVKGGYKYPNLVGKHSLKHFSTHQKLVCHCAVKYLPENELSAIEQRREYYKPSDQYYFSEELRAIVNALKAGEPVDLSRIFSKVSEIPGNTSILVPRNSAREIPWSSSGMNSGNLERAYSGNTAEATVDGFLRVTLQSATPWKSIETISGSSARGFPRRSVGSITGNLPEVQCSAKTNSESLATTVIQGNNERFIPRGFNITNPGTSGNKISNDSSGDNLQYPSDTSRGRLSERILRAGLNDELGDVSFNTPAHALIPDSSRRAIPQAQSSKLFGVPARANPENSSRLYPPKLSLVPAITTTKVYPNNLIKPIPRLAIAGVPILTNLGSPNLHESSNFPPIISGSSSLFSKYPPSTPTLNKLVGPSPRGSVSLALDRTIVNTQQPIEDKGDIDTTLSLGGVFMRSTDLSPNPSSKKKQRAKEWT